MHSDHCQNVCNLCVQVAKSGEVCYIYLAPWQGLSEDTLHIKQVQTIYSNWYRERSSIPSWASTWRQRRGNTPHGANIHGLTPTPKLATFLEPILSPGRQRSTSPRRSQIMQLQHRSIWPSGVTHLERMTFSWRRCEFIHFKWDLWGKSVLLDKFQTDLTKTGWRHSWFVFYWGPWRWQGQSMQHNMLMREESTKWHVIMFLDI